MFKIKYNDLHENAEEPYYAHQDDAGADLKCSEDFSLEPGEFRAIPTGIAIQIPSGYVGLIHPRSGLAARRGITVLNAPGTIDAGYLGEIKVVLINHSKETQSFVAGERIAQIVFQQYEKAVFVLGGFGEDTERGTSGFGSTGTMNS